MILLSKEANAVALKLKLDTHTKTPNRAAGETLVSGISFHSKGRTPYARVQGASNTLQHQHRRNSSTVQARKGSTGEQAFPQSLLQGFELFSNRSLRKNVSLTAGNGTQNPWSHNAMTIILVREQDFGLYMNDLVLAQINGNAVGLGGPLKPKDYGCIK